MLSYVFGSACLLRKNVLQASTSVRLNHLKILILLKVIKYCQFYTAQPTVATICKALTQERLRA